MAASPNIANYLVGKGKVAFKIDGQSNWRDVGNVPSIAFTPKIEKLEHFSSREGVKTKDRTVVISKSGSLKMTMEEWSAANLALALLGDITQPAGRDQIAIFSQNAISGALKFIGTNEVGPRYEVELFKVDFIPSADLNFISDEWGTIEVEGEVSAVNGLFGTVTEIAEEGETPTEEPTF